jgi:ribosomal protein S13
LEHRLKAENHTLKRALTDPRIFSGIGNAYSDEILHRAKLSPVALTSQLPAQHVASLYLATRATLEDWTHKLRADAAGAFPEKVTAFERAWQCMVDSVCLARFAVHRCSASSMPRTETNLLCPLSDRWKSVGRPRTIAAPQEQLAAKY